MKRLYSYNQPEKGYFYIGILCCLANGAAFPLSAWIMAELIWILADFYNPLVPREEFRRKADLYSLYFLIIGIVSLFTQTGMFACMARVGEGLTYRLRHDTFKKMLRMPVSWFDDPQHNPGTLAVRLASEARTVNALTSNIIGLQITNLSSFATGMIIAFYFAWNITLVTLGLSPLMIIAGQMQAKFMTGFSADTDAAYKDSGDLVQEAVTNIRTVASFGNEQILVGFLNERLKKPESIIARKSNIAGLSLGFSQAMMFVLYAIVFYVGAVFHREYHLSMRDMFAAIFAIMFAAFGAGNNNQFMVDIGTAHNAAKNIFEILDAQDEHQLHEARVANQ